MGRLTGLAIIAALCAPSAAFAKATPLFANSQAAKPAPRASLGKQVVRKAERLTRCACTRRYILM
jgi:hypothetical protein